jgi:hypothetical protein
LGLALLLLLAAPVPVLAQSPAAPARAGAAVPVLLAEEGSTTPKSWKRFFSGMATRRRVIPLCAVVMALALFILIKKLAP